MPGVSVADESCIVIVSLLSWGSGLRHTDAVGGVEIVLLFAVCKVLAHLR